MRKGLVYLILVGLTLGVSSRATAGIVVAEQLLVDLRAEDLPYGTVARTWVNHGTLGDFEPQGVPVVEDVAGRKTVTFDGSSYFEGPLSVPGIEGGGTRSIEVWVFNGPDFVGEETMVSWSHRGGPGGTNIAFNYGNHGTWGAVGHWDAPDMPWSGQHSPAPAANNWWYLVYTYDGTTVRLYVNAEENTTRNVTLNTHGPNIIRVAAQANDSGAGVHAAVNFTGSIAEVRIHDGVLSPAAIANNFRSKPGAPTAADPVPADGQVDVPGDVVLSWAAGEFAAAHDVYFGTVFDDVNTAGRGNPTGVLVSQGQAATTYAPPARLDFGQTYYWRVDEVNAAPDNTIFKGDVWSFTAEPLAYPVANVIATSNAASEPGAGPMNAVDGSGLNAADQHSTNNTDMWLGGTGGAEPVWIQFEFDKVYLLHELQVWNYNVIFEMMLGFGFKDVTIEHSEDGVDWTAFGDVQFAQATARSNYTANTTVDLSGVAARFVRLTANSGWGMTGQFGLSEVRFLFVPVQAREPQPEAGAVDVSVDAILDWRSGRQAASHEVYLDIDEAAVIDGTALVATVSQSQYDPGALDLDATYYWRIDEVNEAEAIASWAGEVWSFSTQPFIVIDDFESYTDDIEAGTTIFDTWLDGWVNGTGSTVGYLSTPFAERTTVRSGRQSMPLFYEGDSRADLTIDGAQDWTAGGATTLVVYFRGAIDNGAGQFYATVNSTKVTYPGVLTSPVWKQWNIDLTSLGTNLASVTSFSLGVDGSGSGLLFVDDIRLYRAAPEPVAPADPGTAGLVASYAFENNVQDGSGNGYHGTAFNDPAYLASRPGQGQAIHFDGFADYVELPIGPVMGTLSSATVATWVDFSGTSGAWQRIFDFGTSSTAGYMFLCPRTGTSGPIRFAITPAGGAGESIVETPRSVPTDGWHHVAVVIDSATMTVQVYVDGEAAASGATATLPRDLGVTTQNWLARSQYTADAYFGGSLDDFAIYSRALSPGEVRYLAGDR
ncbi:LamG-like jellyroll fold domain-containing protein [Anaerobaca lacustris]|uniref:Discoidin domain-containing protein n=1 Tax=Anaerobaca lacustris TaxID=3044600 RepID=A0AAW6TXD0_9BACT|nr:discoidin domain-containing protein [Sedimentisphaerales bacterium M17dextr]